MNLANSGPTKSQTRPPPITWQTLEMFLFSTGQVMTITDPLGTNALRFYRVQAQ